MYKQNVLPNEGDFTFSRDSTATLEPIRYFEPFSFTVLSGIFCALNAQVLEF